MAPIAQYKRIKSKYPDAIILMRNCGFYETYQDDAKVVSKCLGITLSRRIDGDKDYITIFPKDYLNTYLPRLVRAGNRVAICDNNLV